jgi:6-hydroxycyclohex-1-ene-1-carbonyl-CoA dehydrogenase
LRSGLEPGGFAIVIGLGGVGGFAAQIAKAFDATVVGIDVNAQKLDALKHHGLDLAIDATQHDAKSIKAQLHDYAKQHGIPAVGWRIFECSGSAPGQELAWNLLCHGAFLSVVGFTMDRVNVRLSNLMAFDATAQGNWGCLPENYQGALQLVLDGKVALKPFVEIHPLEDIRRVMEDVHNHRLNKRAVLVPTDSRETL